MTAKFSNIDLPQPGPYIKEIFSFQSYRPHGIKTFRYFADGLPGIMFQQSENGMYLNGGEKKLSPLFLYGQTINPIEITCTGRFRMIIFYLYPHMLRTLFAIEASELCDSCLDFNELQVAGAQEVTFAMEMQTTSGDQIRVLQHFLAGRVPEQSETLDLDGAVKSIEMNHDTFNISAISTGFNVSPRNFQRIFKQYVGISPRLYARISKFNKARNLIESGKYRQLTQLAMDSEYSDQSHFSRTFKEFTGLTPKSFLARIQKD